LNKPLDPFDPFDPFDTFGSRDPLEHFEPPHTFETVETFETFEATATPNRPRIGDTAIAPDTASTPNIHTLLKTVFGYSAFRGHQQAVIEQVVAGGDALVLMPTGGGKSLCYQIPALARQQVGKGITVVVSPLIALMHDQVGALHEAGVSAAFLNSSLSNEQAADTERKLLRGEITLLYAAPERINNPRFLGLLDSLYERGLLGLFAIDEAHCVSQWGHDFRPEYRALSLLPERYAATPRIALTATADALTRADIVERLQLHQAQHFVSSFDRPNIEYHIIEKIDVRKQLLRFIQTEYPHDAGIVYCLSRKTVEEVAALLCEHGIRALPYHAGLDRDVRQRNQDLFIKGDGSDNPVPVVMVATIAFGMGIDKPDVRFVAHVDMPKNIEGYYQETGRAGRDGSASKAWLCYGLQDVISQKRMIDESPAADAYKEVMRGKLDALLGLAETVECRRGRLLAYFDDATLANHPQPYRCQRCDNCMVPPKTWDAALPARKLLSCVYRLAQASPGLGFSGTHTIDVLRGKTSTAIERFKHQQVSTYGIGADVSETVWRSVLRQLITRGMVAVDAASYNALHILDAGRHFLRSDAPMLLRAMPERSVSSRSSTGKSKSNATAASTDAPPTANSQLDRILRNLKTWRAAVAKEHDLPAYVIFHDATLLAIATLAPHTLDDLGGISGMGARKLAAYGADVLRVVDSQRDDE
jgi:ATP-dependent DNA helicase RecQ